MRVGMQKWSAALVIAVFVVAYVLTSLGADDGTYASQPSAPRSASWPPTSQVPADPQLAIEDLGSGLPACDFNDLPATSLNVIDDIEDGGPFDYPRDDGGTFGNFEGLLPSESNGYYREYTVETPGLSHRGARRIVTGGFDEDSPEEWFFTSDHYGSFCKFARSQ